MKIPETTHLQFLVLQSLLDGEQKGERIREDLARFGVKKTLPAFYQLMSRLEETGLIKGRYEQLVIDGQPVKQRRYKLLAAGQRAWESTRDFYMEFAGGGIQNASYAS